MSYRANVDIVVALNALKITSFRKQGFLRFKITLCHRLLNYLEQNKAKKNNENITYCSPYNIYKQQNSTVVLGKDPKKVYSNSASKLNMHYVQQREQLQQQSYIDHDEQCYYSRVFESKFQSQLHKIDECCYFRKYIDSQDIQHSSFVAKTAQRSSISLAMQHYIQAGIYQACIHRISGFTTFMPIEFDEFGGFSISALYQAITLEYRFQGDQGKEQYANFGDYMDAATKGLRFDEFLNFFNYYRGSLETELTVIQQRHADLLNFLRISTNFNIVKVNPNQVILNLATFLTNPGTNMSQNHFNKYNQQLKQRLCDQISRDFVFIKALIHQKWNEFIAFIGSNLPALTHHYKLSYDSHVKDRLKTHVFSHKIEPKWDWTFSRYQDSGKQLLLQAQLDKLKHKEQELWRQQFPIEGAHLFSQQKKTIKIFEEIYQVRANLLTQRSLSPTASHRSNLLINRFTSIQQGRQCSPRSLFNTNSFQALKFHDQTQYQPRQPMPFFHAKQTEALGFKLPRTNLQTPVLQSKQHIVVFVHGFQASRQDFVLFKSCLQIQYGCRVFISSTNEGRTQQSIQALGKHLAVQLNHLFKTIEFGPNTRISFVGHSMGGIIIRSALSYIKNLQPYLYSYMSFSSPHLGYMYQPSKLVQAGLWLLNALQSVKSLEELCMKDNNDPRRSLLYRLSQNNSLHGFRKLALISSSQDEYVPYESARIQKNQKLMHQLGHQNSTIVKEMVDNVLGEIKATEISRMNVVFDIQDKNFDSIVGRTAHVKYLSDQKFIKMFSIVFQKFFA